MPNHLTIGGTDVSSFLSGNDYSVRTEPVFDTDSEFVNIYGETVRTRVGRKITIHAVLTDANDSTYSALASAALQESVTVSYSAPDTQSGGFSVESISASLDRVFDGVRFWTVDISLAGYVRECL